jgi:hypothetical protein
VYQAYLTTFLIEPGYEEPIRKFEEMLRSKKMFDFVAQNFSDNNYFPGASVIAKDADLCPDEPTCFVWAAVYNNISTAIHDLGMEIYRVKGDWTNKLRDFY